MIQIPTNTVLLRQILIAFIRNEVRKTGLVRVVVGLSGGVDSALSAMFAAEALGPKNVLGVMMPYKNSNPDSQAHAEMVARKERHRVAAASTSRRRSTPTSSASRRRRAPARQQDGARAHDDPLRPLGALDALVLGTSNKTELLLGYGTLYGDMASALNPIGDLYKTQVWALAGSIGVPAVIVRRSRRPTSGAARPTSASSGFSYHEVDRLLYLMVDERYDQRGARRRRLHAERFVDRIATRNHDIRSSSAACR